MLAQSTSTARSGYTDSTLLAASVDLQVVEVIFQRGKHATSFPQIFRPYTEVLQENGISPTDDSAYYNFVLKVGVIKAPTWGEKWELWKAAHTQDASTLPNNTRDESKAKSSTSFASSKLPEVRKRVPFLASASSDLDEGYTGGEDSDASVRPSPRKEWAKRDIKAPQVGYDRTQSIDVTGEEDLLSFDPPIRTSTPIYAQYPRGGPPAYTASDISQAMDHTDRTDETAGSLADLRITTPKAQHRPDDETQTISWVDRIDDLSFEVRKEMEQRADMFYRYGLVWRCWNMWFKTSEWYRITYRNIIVARDNLLLRQVLEKWNKSAHLLKSLPATADRHHQRHLKSLVFKAWLAILKDRNLERIEDQWKTVKRHDKVALVFGLWKKRWQAKRAERWKKDMSEKELVLVEKRRKALLSKVYTHWRVETRCKLLQSSKTMSLKTSILQHWHDATLNEQHLKSLFSTFEQSQKANLLYIWRKKSILRPLERNLVAEREGGLMKRVWETWRIASWQSTMSRRLDRRRLLLSVMEEWKEARHRQLVIERKARTYADVRLLQSTLKTWRVSSREKLFEQIRAKRLVKKSWSEWQSEKARVDGLNVLADKHLVIRQNHTLQTLISRWRTNLSHLHTLSLQANLIHCHHLLSSAFFKWRSSSHTVITNEALADKAYGFFALRTSFKVWRGMLGRKRVERWIAKKENGRMREVFDKWNTLTHRYIDLDRRETVLRTFVDEQTRRRLLARWTERVVEVKDRELRVTRQRDDRLIRGSLSRWHTRSVDLESKKRKADDLFEIRENETLRRLFRSWRVKTKQSKRLRLAANQYILERESRTMRKAWDKWYERKRERDLEDIATEVEFLHENVILYGVFDKWKATTEILPGITADGLRLRARTWSIWQVALRRHQNAKALEGERDRKLLAETFAIWRDATTRKTILSARRVRGRARPSGASYPSTIAPRRSLPFPQMHSQPKAHYHSRTGSSAHPPTYPSIARTRSDGYDQPRAESVRSEPVFSKLREELGRKRGGSEEPVGQVDHWAGDRISGPDQRGRAMEAGDNVMERPRSGSEMLRALRGAMPGR